MKSKRGAYFFIIDVIIGVFIFVMTILIISSFSVPKTSLGAVEQNLDVVAIDFFETTVGEFKSVDPNLYDSLPYEFVRDPSLSLDELIYYLHYEGRNDLAREVVISSTSWLPSNYGFSYGVRTFSYTRDKAGSSDILMNLSMKKMTIVLVSIDEILPTGTTVISVWT